MNNVKVFCYPRLRKSGLGNLLFDWAEAESFAHKYGCGVLAPSWVRLIRIGVWLRRERYKRFYGGQFTTKGFVVGLKRLWVLLRYPRIPAHIIACSRLTAPYTGIGYIEFTRCVYNWFDNFIDDQPYLRRRLYEIVNPVLVKRSEVAQPYVGVHIRRGDFCCSELKTSDEWFIDAIRAALTHPCAAGVKDIRVCSDDYPENLAFLQRAFPNWNVIIMPKAPPIQDVLLLSRARVLVGSPRSSFSMWAVFLGQMPSYWSSRYEVPRLYYEGEHDKLFLVEEKR